MGEKDPDELERVDQEIRINELRHKAEELAGGQMVAWESEECPPDIQESFWRRVVEYERAGWTSHSEQLTRAWVELPPAGALDDPALSAKLRELVEALARMRVFVHNTNHLSDRELYEELVGEVLHERVADVPADPHGCYVIDLLGSGSDEDTRLYLRYYADEEWRRQWAKDFPEDEIPPHEDPPYDRDRFLPREEF